MGNMAAQIYRDSKTADDAKRILLSEIRERKELARNAGRRKSGAKSTKCDLPSDHMTKKEWRSMNGPVEKSMLPITRLAFLKKTDDYRARWYKWVREEFAATSTMVAKLQGEYADSKMIKDEIRALEKRGFDVGRCPNKAPSNEHLTKWNAWLAKHNWTNGVIDIDDYYAQLSAGRAKAIAKNRSIKKEGENDMQLKVNMSNPVPPQVSHAVEPVSGLRRLTKDDINQSIAAVATQGDTHIVIKADLTRPMIYGDYKKMSDADRAEYLTFLRTVYRVGDIPIAKMMGITQHVILDDRKALTEKGYKFEKLPHTREDSIVQQWNQWLRDNNWTLGLIEKKVHPRIDKYEKMAHGQTTKKSTGGKRSDGSMTETELKKHIEKLGVTMSDPKVDMTTALPQSAFSRTLSPGEDPEELIGWMKAGIQFLGTKKLRISISIEEDQ